MPFVSDRQRRFFHTESARKHGITPAMVREYDDASRDQRIPERAEKHAATGVGATSGATSGVSTAVSAPKPPSMGAPKYKSEGAQHGPLRQPSPGDYKQNFLESSASAAQRSTADKFEAGEQATLPVTR